MFSGTFGHCVDILSLPLPPLTHNTHILSQFPVKSSDFIGTCVGGICVANELYHFNDYLINVHCNTELAPGLESDNFPDTNIKLFEVSHRNHLHPAHVILRLYRVSQILYRVSQILYRVSQTEFYFW